MSSFIGSEVSGIYVDDTQVTIISNSNNVIQLQTSSATVDFGGYQISNIGAMGEELDMGNHKITNLADATLATDALNRQTADSRYLSVSTTLDQIVAPADDVSLNSHKITSLASGTQSTDAMNFGQDLRNYWLSGYLTSDISTGFTSTYVVKFPNTYGPSTLSPAVTNSVSYSSSTGLFTLAVGKYQIVINTELAYDNGTNAPAQVDVIASVDGTIKHFITNRAPALNIKQTTNYSFIYDCTASQTLSLSLTLDTTKTATLGTGTNIYIQQIC